MAASRALIITVLFGALSAGCVLDYDQLRRGRGEHDGGGIDAFIPDGGPIDGGNDVGTDAGPPPPDAGRDAFVPRDSGLACQRDAAHCDDGIFCNGVETCAPGPDAGANGCLPGTPPCYPGVSTCNETFSRCDVFCTDADGDHHGQTSCGGDDCDDADISIHPGALEVCDVGNIDEDCNCMTYGSRDADGDGYTSDACCNCVGMAGETCGTDCDDTMGGINPGIVVDPPGGFDLNCDGTP